MRVHFEDHAGFQRATLHVAVACSALAAVAALSGAGQRPATAVLGAAIATLALALGHLRFVVDPASDALARAADAADAGERPLLARARRAVEALRRAVARGGAAAPEEGRALEAAATRAAIALCDLLRRRGELQHQIQHALPPDAAAELEALEARREGARDDLARQTFARAAGALRDRAARAHTLEAVVERIDARLAAAVAELEGAAFAVATRAELAPGDPPAALAAACDRLRTASADLGAECEALAELGSS